MINGLEGVPGSGKSYEAVVYHVLEAVKSGRLVITNLPLQVDMFSAIDPAYRNLIELRTKASPVRGTWDADRVDESGNGNAFELHPDGATSKPDAGVTTFGHVWDFYSTWKHPKTGVGPLFVVDECHNPLPTEGTPSAVIEWFKLHRHYNADVLLMTQSFRDMCQPIARLMGVLVKVRKADILGKADHYIRKVHGGYRGAVISTEQRKYRAEMFPLYKSHTQGNGVAELGVSDVAPFIVKFKRASWVFYAITAVVVAWAFWPSGNKPKVVDRNAPLGGEMQERVNRAVAAYPGPVQPTPQAAAKSVPEVDSGPPEPYGSKSLHLTGRVEMGNRVLYAFAVSESGRRIVDLTSEDLKRAGYVWEPMTDCAGTLRWRGKAKAVTCDAPALAQGSQSAPVVVDVNGRPPGATPPAASPQFTSM